MNNTQTTQSPDSSPAGGYLKRRFEESSKPREYPLLCTHWDSIMEKDSEELHTFVRVLRTNQLYFVGKARCRLDISSQHGYVAPMAWYPPFRTKKVFKAKNLHRILEEELQEIPFDNTWRSTAPFRFFRHTAYRDGISYNLPTLHRLVIEGYYNVDGPMEVPQVTRRLTVWWLYNSTDGIRDRGDVDRSLTSKFTETSL